MAQEEHTEERYAFQEYTTPSHFPPKDPALSGPKLKRPVVEVNPLLAVTCGLEALHALIQRRAVGAGFASFSPPAAPPSFPSGGGGGHDDGDDGEVANLNEAGALSLAADSRLLSAWTSRTLVVAADGAGAYEDNGCLPVDDVGSLPLLGRRYRALGLLGEGTFAQILRCEDTFDARPFSLAESAESGSGHSSSSEHSGSRRRRRQRGAAGKGYSSARQKRVVAVKVMNRRFGELGVREAKCLEAVHAFGEHVPAVGFHGTLWYLGHFCLVLDVAMASLLDTAFLGKPLLFSSCLKQQRSRSSSSSSSSSGGATEAAAGVVRLWGAVSPQARLWREEEVEAITLPTSAAAAAAAHSQRLAEEHRHFDPHKRKQQQKQQQKQRPVLVREYPLRPHTSVGVVRLVARELCSVLAVLAANGIVHADIKPENVLLVDPHVLAQERSRVECRGNSDYFSDDDDDDGGDDDDDGGDGGGSRHGDACDDEHVCGGSPPLFCVRLGDFGNALHAPSEAWHYDGGPRRVHAAPAPVASSASSRRARSDSGGDHSSNGGVGAGDLPNHDVVDSSCLFDVQSFGYRAPEVLCGLAGSVGPAVDAWSLGVLLTELWLGVPLFRAAADSENGQDEDEEGCEEEGGAGAENKWAPLPVASASSFGAAAASAAVLTPNACPNAVASATAVARAHELELELELGVRKRKQRRRVLREVVRLFGDLPPLLAAAGKAARVAPAPQQTPPPPPFPPPSSASTTPLSSWPLKCHHRRVFELLQTKANAKNPKGRVTRPPPLGLVQFVAALLELDPRERMTMDQALSHPFLSSSSSSSMPFPALHRAVCVLEQQRREEQKQQGRMHATSSRRPAVTVAISSSSSIFSGGGGVGNAVKASSSPLPSPLIDQPPPPPPSSSSSSLGLPSSSLASAASARQRRFKLVRRTTAVAESEMATETATAAVAASSQNDDDDDSGGGGSGGGDVDNLGSRSGFEVVSPTAPTLFNLSTSLHLQPLELASSPSTVSSSSSSSAFSPSPSSTALSSASSSASSTCLSLTFSSASSLKRRPSPRIVLKKRNGGGGSSSSSSNSSATSTTASGFRDSAARSNTSGAGGLDSRRRQGSERRPPVAVEASTSSLLPVGLGDDAPTPTASHARRHTDHVEADGEGGGDDQEGGGGTYGGVVVGGGGVIDVASSDDAGEDDQVSNDDDDDDDDADDDDRVNLLEEEEEDHNESEDGEYKVDEQDGDVDDGLRDDDTDTENDTKENEEDEDEEEEGGDADEYEDQHEDDGNGEGGRKRQKPLLSSLSPSSSQRATARRPLRRPLPPAAAAGIHQASSRPISSLVVAVPESNPHRRHHGPKVRSAGTALLETRGGGEEGGEDGSTPASDSDDSWGAL